MGHWVPHTDAEIETMLAFLGIEDVETLFDTVPDAIKLVGGLGIEPGISQADVLRQAQALGSRNRAPELVCFAGAGAYDHELPAVTSALAGRSEFLTAYTPYQPEVAQGVLQALFEYQTLVARLAGLQVANSSLYDGASALVEAINLACAETGRERVWISQGVHPHWRQVVSTMARGTGHRIEEVPLLDGITRWPENADGPGGAPGAVVVSYPNHLGCLEDPAAVRELATELGSLMVVAFDPVASGLLRSPGDWGADVAVGEGQTLGIPLSFGGPYLGLFACTRDHLRRVPGRIVGETVDTGGKTAYVTTLRAREQDIRREKASSNICTNQTLMAVTAAVQLGWLGTRGLADLALRCARATRYCRQLLLEIEGVRPAASAPVLREFSVRAPVRGEVLVDRLAEEGFLAGVVLGEGMEQSDCDGALLVSVTERRTREEIDAFAAAFEKAARK